MSDSTSPPHGRWIIHEIKMGVPGTAKITGALRRDDVFPVEVVPCDDAAIERAVRAIHDLLPYEESRPGPSREIVETAFRAAAEETP